jgi:ATP-dependent DNA ligase
MTKLFKKDSKGKIRIFKTYTWGDELVQLSGLYEGKLVESRKVCKPKNVGRSNETTGSEQAVLEMNSKIAEKLKEDYFNTIEEAETIQVILPMLAKSYKDYSHKIKWGVDRVFVQPKLDGMRALGTTGPNATLTSREGTSITTMQHIVEDLKQMPDGHVLDGELYCFGESFQDNMKLIKKYRKGESERVKYHVYDIIEDKPFYKRKVRDFVKGSNTLVEVSTYEIDNEEQLKKFHAENISQGYEGSMIRYGDSSYKINGRSDSLLKYKDFIDIQLPILDIVPADARPEWGQAVYYWEGASGHPLGENIIGSGMKLSHEDRKEWLLNKENYVGKIAEVRFFEFSNTGVPRFPVTVGLR